MIDRKNHKYSNQRSVKRGFPLIYLVVARTNFYFHLLFSASIRWKGEVVEEFDSSGPSGRRSVELFSATTITALH